jgi:hypothetical protein
MLLVFPSQKGFVWVFRGCAPVGRRSGSLPPIQPRLLEDPPILPTDSAIEPDFKKPRLGRSAESGVFSMGYVETKGLVLAPREERTNGTSKREFDGEGFSRVLTGRGISEVRTVLGGNSGMAIVERQNRAFSTSCSSRRTQASPVSLEVIRLRANMPPLGSMRPKVRAGNMGWPGAYCHTATFDLADGR